MNNADRPEKLAQLQTAFAAHLRDPDSTPPPDGIEDRRMQIYRDLFFNNICKFLASNFPVLYKIYGEEAWRKLAREFYIEHRAHTPLFPELPKEFLRYVQEQRVDRPEDPPFLLELAHYEWVELALGLDTHELDEVVADAQGDLVQGIPVLSPLAWPLAYRFPVHRISPEFQPDTAPAEASRILAYRDRGDTVRFMELNPVSWILLEKLKTATLTGEQILKSIAVDIGHANPDAVLQHGRQILADLHQRDVLLGTRT